MIRSHIYQFIEVHNSHPIRLQRNRQHYLPTGQTFLLYYYPESRKDYKQKVDEKVLAALEAEVADYDLDEYLPVSTLELYAKCLQEGGYPPQFSSSNTRHHEAYLYFRDRVSLYIAQGDEIELVSRPSGAADWILANGTHEIEAHCGYINGISGDTMLQLTSTDEESENEPEQQEEVQEEPERNSINDIPSSNYHVGEISTTSDSIYNNNPGLFINLDGELVF